MRTGEEILSSLYQKAIGDELLTTRFEQGRIGLLFSVIARELNVFEGYIENYIQEMNLRTAVQNLNVELEAMPFHVRQPARASTVILRFTKDKEIITEDYLIPHGLYIETAGNNPIVYATAEAKTLYKENDYIDVIAYSTEPGTSSIVLPDKLVIFTGGYRNGLSVTNPKASYGGIDQENLESLRQSALNFRYLLDSSSFAGLSEALTDYGLRMKDFNLVENTYGKGSVVLYLDTPNEAVLEEIEGLLTNIKAGGIYLICEQAVHVPIEFAFDVEVSSKKRLTPEERNRLKSEISLMFMDFVESLGVGKSLVLTQAISYIYSNLVTQWALADIHVKTEGATENIDERGNVIVKDWERIDVQQLKITTRTG